MEARGLFAAGKIKAEELAAAETHLTERSKLLNQALRGGKFDNHMLGLFGLRPYELQNLTYQINDVFTQLASGTSLTQTLAQQGGQFFQLFQARLAGLVPYIPLLAAAAAVIAPFVIGLNRLYDLRAQARAFNAVLAETADGARYQTAELIKATRALDHYGVSAKDATAVVKLFVREGLDPARFEQMGKAAKSLAGVMGTAGAAK